MTGQEDTWIRSQEAARRAEAQAAAATQDAVRALAAQQAAEAELADLRERARCDEPARVDLTQLFGGEWPAGKPLDELYLERLHPSLRAMFVSSPTLKAMWQHEVKAALDGMTTDDVSKLDPNQLKQLMEAEKEVDARIGEVNKIVE
ncbi:SAMS2, partial [Symbiodinium sp. KB8]